MKFHKQTPLEKEMAVIQKKEVNYLKKNKDEKHFFMSQKLENKVPEKLQSTLNMAFFKAFHLVFEKGTNVIEKTYSKQEMEHNYKVGAYAVDLEENKKTLRSFSKNAGKSNNKNLLMTSVEGLGLGLLGIGLPDIPLFTAMMLKSIYETAVHYGYPNDTKEEKFFILLLIQGAFIYGDELVQLNDKINKYIVTKQLPDNYDLEKQILETADLLSKELLYSKFLQGIPIAGMIGGAGDMIYLNKILSYSKIKYQKRFLIERN